MALVFQTTVLPGDIAKEIISIPPLKNALKLLYLQDIQEQSKRLCRVKENSSILRVGSKSYKELFSFKWAKLLSEWEEKAPDVLDAVSAVAVTENALRKSHRADALIPPICTAVSILLNARDEKMSLMQKLVSVIVGIGGCSKMVC